MLRNTKCLLFAILMSSLFVPAGFGGKQKLEIVPGYEVCSVYYFMEDTGEKSVPPDGELLVRRAGESVWTRVLDPVFVPAEHSLRGSIFPLLENEAYELRLTVSQGGKTRTLERSFRTLNKNVPIAKTIVLDEQTRFPLRIRESGTENGYIRYTQKPGCVLDGGMAKGGVLLLQQVSYILLDGLTIRGGERDAVRIDSCSDIQIVNCNISGFGRTGRQCPEKDGKYRDARGQRINQDAGIRIIDSNRILVERNFIHSPRGTANGWFHAHPEGPNAVIIGNGKGVALRYNDFLGSSKHRWNDAVEGINNGRPEGGPCRDAEICGNYFFCANDDGMELDGGQINARFFLNRSEATFCGVSTAPILSGPAYYYRNLFCGTGAEFGDAGVAFKNIFRDPGRGRVFFLYNTLVGSWGGFSAFGGTPERLAPVRGSFRAFARNNLLALENLPVSSGLFRNFRNDFDYDLIWNSLTETDYAAAWRKMFHQEAHGMSAAPDFLNAEHGIYRLKKSSPGVGAAGEVPGMRGKNIGAFQDDCILALPHRPLRFHLPKDRLIFRLDSSAAPPAQTLPVQCDAAFSAPFRIERGDHSFLRIAPECGILNEKTVFQITIDPARIPSASLHAEAFRIVLPDGMARTVAVYADSRNNLQLLKQDRKNVVYGKISRSGEKWILDFELEKPMLAFLFVRLEKPVFLKAKVSHNGGREKMASIRGSADQRPVPIWKSIGAADRKENPQIRLAAGKHRFIVTFVQEGAVVLDTALAAMPDELLDAPYSNLPSRN